jgi:hypothetical protein
MPDEKNPQQGTGGQPAQAGANNNPQGGSQQSQVQEPEWIQHVPEQHRETARKGWMQEADYTRKLQEFSDGKKGWETEKADYEKRVAQWNEFQTAYQPFYQNLQKNWDKIQPILSGQQLPQQDHQQQNGVDKQFENWDMLQPQEQAKRIAEHVNQNYLAQELAKIQNNFNQQLAQREQYYQNYLNVFADAHQRQLKNPNLDVNEYMRKVLEIQQGKQNPMDLAYAAMTGPEKEKAIEEAAFKRGREEAELEFKNKQQTNGAIQNPMIPNFKVPPMTREQVADKVRQEAITKGLTW